MNSNINGFWEFFSHKAKKSEYNRMLYSDLIISERFILIPPKKIWFYICNYIIILLLLKILHYSFVFLHNTIFFFDFGRYFMEKNQYEIYHENKKHTPNDFPYNTYLCSIPLDFKSVNLH